MHQHVVRPFNQSENSPISNFLIPLTPCVLPPLSPPSPPCAASSSASSKSATPDSYPDRGEDTDSSVTAGGDDSYSAGSATDSYTVSGWGGGRGGVGDISRTELGDVRHGYKLIGYINVICEDVECVRCDLWYLVLNSS